VEEEKERCSGSFHLAPFPDLEFPRSERQWEMESMEGKSRQKNKSRKEMKLELIKHKKFNKITAHNRKGVLRKRKKKD